MPHLYAINQFFSRYQNELPKKIKSRGKDAHLVHEELVQTIKWKLAVSLKGFFWKWHINRQFFIIKTEILYN